MMYFHPFHLESFAEITAHALDQTQSWGGTSIYINNIDISKRLRDLLEDELRSYNLPGVVNFLVFKRKKFFELNPRLTHIDSMYVKLIRSGYISETIHSSIVLPIEGFQNTKMYWADGEYRCETAFLPSGSPYEKIIWGDNCKVVAEHEIIEPTLTRVDVPHSATSNSDGSYRTILSIRLQNNPTFEEILNKRYYKN